MSVDKLKVLQFGRYFPPHIGGTEQVMYDLTNGLNEDGVTCDVLCCNDTNSYAIEERNGHKVIRNKTILKVGSIAISPQQIFTLRKIANDYDVIQVHHPAPMATVALWLIRPKTKLVVYWHSDIVRQKVLLTFFKPFQNWLLKRASAIVATTPYYIKGSDALLKYPDKTTFIPIGIAGMTANNSFTNKLRSTYQNKKIVFSLGRLVEYKGFIYLAEAARYLSDDYVILIGGEGRLRKEIEDKIREHKLENRVKLLGKVPESELSAYFEICDLFCLSSVTKNEAFGLVIIEAMSLSKPIVATKIPGSGVHWVNEDGVSGINVEVEDAIALASAIKEILETPARNQSLKEGALKRFNSLFKKEKMVSSFKNLYLNVLNSK